MSAPSQVSPEALNKAKAIGALVMLKLFQIPIFWSETKTLVLHWSRQIGKSYVLAAWALYRIFSKALAGKNWQVFVLSNSKKNGGEFMLKVEQICRLLNIAAEIEDLSLGDALETMQFVCRLSILGCTGRIEVLAADPRTARGFSGDLILDEFAFHLNSSAIWEAAEPILSANADYQCRIASTGNGTSNKFYEMVRGCFVVATKENPAGLSLSEAGFWVSRVPRSSAYLLGQKIYDLKTGKETTPEAARAAALDKAAYDVNYELALSDASSQLLTDEDINGCEYQGAAKECVLCEQEWTVEALQFLAAQPGPLGFGMDVGRTRNLSTIAVGPKVGNTIFVRAILRMRDTRLPEQQRQLARLFELPNIGSGEIDMTGIGLGLVEYAQDELGSYRVRGVNFATTQKRDERQALIAAEMGLPPESANVKELMGLDVLSTFVRRAIRIPAVGWLRDSLKKPHKVVRENKVFLSAADDAEGHADEFWAIALLIRALLGRPWGIQSTEDVVLPDKQRTPSGLRRFFSPRRLFGRERDEEAHL